MRKLMRFRIASILIVIPLAVGISVFSQERSSASSGHFATFSELLKDHNIERTTSALIVALQNPDAYVRGLAALVLAEDRTSSAIPAIKEALTAEKV
jgi:HEAT repeat protein